MLQGALIRRVQDLLAWDTLLALALLHEKVLTAIALVGELAASCAPEAFLCAAVGLHSWHVARKGNGERADCKELPLRAKDNHEVIALPFYWRFDLRYIRQTVDKSV